MAGKSAPALPQKSQKGSWQMDGWHDIDFITSTEVVKEVKYATDLKVFPVIVTVARRGYAM
jgi:hypothetical protein